MADAFAPLSSLITAALELAGADVVSAGGRLWQSEGGRSCPLGWGDCSQAVYVDLKTGAYDHGEPGGPGHADCLRHCRHGRQPCPEPDDEDDGAEDRRTPPAGDAQPPQESNHA